MQRPLDMPWAALDEARRLMTLPYIRILFTLHGISWGQGWKIFGAPIIQRHRGSRIVLGNGLSLRSTRASNPLTPNHPVVLATRSAAATIVVGHDCGFTGTTLVAAERIQIGNRVFVGANVTITDTDFHPLDPEERLHAPNDGRHRPVVIEDDVFIGMNSIILKGVTVGRGTVIGAGSVVTSDIPDNVIAAGNPACVIPRR